jgi:hypothetical protein
MNIYCFFCKHFKNLNIKIKAVTNDVISDTWLKKTKRCDLLCDLWNHATQLLALEYEAFRYTSA